MKFQDNVIKEYLKNVYFVAGTACGGKTTVSKELGRKYHIPVYASDEMFSLHQQISNAKNQPSMNKSFKDADEFFGRTVEEYRDWLVRNTREDLEFVIMDLIKLSQNGPVICDCHLTLSEAEALTSSDRIVFLIKEPTDPVNDYCERPDHRDFNAFIHSAADVEVAKAKCGEALKSLNGKHYREIKKSDYFWLERDVSRSVEETVELVAKHFGMRGME